MQLTQTSCYFQINQIMHLLKRQIWTLYPIYPILEDVGSVINQLHITIMPIKILLKE